MTQRQAFANIGLHLVKVLHTVISERSVSRAALQRQSTQPIVSAPLQRLRALTGLALLVRSGQGLAPTAAALHSGAAGEIDPHLAAQGLRRNIVVRAARFGLIALMVARSRLVLTTGRLCCTRCLQPLGLRIVRCSLSLPPMSYYMLWHERSRAAPALRWLRERMRERMREAARGLGGAGA